MLENVDDVEGSVNVSHSFRHEINWGHVALGIAVVFAVYKVAAAYASSSSDNGNQLKS